MRGGLHLLGRGDAQNPEAIFERVANRVHQRNLVSCRGCAVEYLFLRIPAVERARELKEVIRNKMRFKFACRIFHDFWETPEQTRDIVRRRIRINLCINMFPLRLLDDLLCARVSILKIRTRISLEREGALTVKNNILAGTLLK